MDARRRGLVADEIASYDELSHALLAAGERDEAWSVAVYAIQLLRERQVGWDCLLRIVATLARCAASFGDARQAFVLAGAVRSASTELRHTLVPARAAAVEAGEIEARGSLDERAAARATADGEATSVESLLAYLGTLEAARPLGRRPGRQEDWVVGQSDQSDPVPRIDRPRYRRYLDDMNEDEVPEPFTVPVPPGFPPPHGGDRVLFYRTHETAGGPGGKDHEDIMLRRVPREIAMRYRAAAGGRAMTHAQYLTALVELHARIRERADAGDETARAVLDELGLQTVAV